MAAQEAGTVVQAKMAIRPPGDQYEQEADRVAAQVVKQINTPAPQAELQREVTDEKDEALQMKSLSQGVPNAGIATSPELEASINHARGNGQPLPDTIREPMEQAFGTDFSGVRVHTDAQSDQLNQSINAEAFTTGQDIFFRQGTYMPKNQDGQGLLAHELTHVMQQSGGEQSGISLSTSANVVQCKKTTQPANQEVFKEFSSHKFPVNVLANAKNIHEKDDAIWQHLNATYDESLRNGTKYWNELQVTITNFKNSRQTIIDANRRKRADYKSKFNANYANTVEPTASNYRVNTEGYDPDQNSQPTVPQGQQEGDYSNRFDITSGKIEADWIFGDWDEARKAGKGLNSSEIFYRQFKLAARDYYSGNPDIKNQVKTALKNISTINQNSVI
ncbi:MAG: DUF4157 domain-containing protein, partial [Microcystaceae cyanobacterium]